MLHNRVEFAPQEHVLWDSDNKISVITEHLVNVGNGSDIILNMLNDIKCADHVELCREDSLRYVELDEVHTWQLALRVEESLEIDL